MLNVLGCITGEHDLRLVGLAVGVCAITCLLAFRLYAQARRESRFFRNLWIAATGVAAGSGVWATHFIAMLAFEPGMRSGYEPVLTVASLFVAILGMSAAFAAGSLRPTANVRIIAGAGLGLSIGAMHYMGMAAFRTEGTVQWDWSYVIASLLGGSVLTAAALWTAGDGQRWKRGVCAALLLAAGIATLHFTGMTGMAIVPDPTVVLPAMAVSPGILATAIAFLVGVTVFGALGAVFIASRSQVQALGDLREAIEAMPAGLAFFDRDDRLVVYNQNYADYGGDCAYLVKPGARFRDLIQAQIDVDMLPDAAGRGAEWLEERLAARRAGIEPQEQENGDRWLRVEDRPTPGGGVISIIHDITDLKRDAAALAVARDQAEAANRAKSEFLANMSHELRTPLNGVIGVSQALASTRMTAKQREMLRMIESSALALQGVLADLLDLARIESGRMELARERFGMAEVVRDAAALWRLEAHKKGLELRVEVEPSAEADVEGDQVRLRQVIVNLLSNSVKFTETGEVVLRLSRKASDPDRVILEVRDTGVGFSPEIAERLFERFEQADGSVTRRFGGTGLGLAISRDLIERMGGTISAVGETGKGATFRVELCLPALASAVAVDDAPAPQQDSSRGLRVLAAEDHPINRKVIEFILEPAGIAVTFAENGQRAVELFKSQAFDAVLMDMQMPVMDGVSATRAIRAFEAESGRDRTPLLMATAHALPEHIQAARSAGADGHLTKPLAAKDVLKALAALTARADRACSAAA